MLILAEKHAIFVAVPKTGSMALSRYIERSVRPDDVAGPDAERLHEWHATLEEVQPFLPFSVYDVWSFAVVRNPFDRLVSYCAGHDPHFQVNHKESISAALARVLRGEADRWLAPQVDLTAGVKTLFRYENLLHDFETILERLEIPVPEQMPRENESERGPYRTYFDGDLKAMVETAYADDLASFGYRF